MSARQCNECTLCCKLLPVAELHKPANVRCGFSRAGKGCIVHSRPNYPTSCRLWACAWLQDPAAELLPRPDRAHYVVDMALDYIEIEAHGERFRVDVVQVWCDPKYPHAHRDPALRAYLAARAALFHQAALVRFNERDAITLFAPSMTDGDEWIEQGGGCVQEQHTPAEIANSKGSGR